MYFASISSFSRSEFSDSINEISKLYNIGQDSLRYYEELGILHPMRDKNNYRQYTTSDIHRLNVIRDLRNLGFSMKSIQDYLENRTIANSLSFMEEEERIINQKIQELYQLKVDILHRKASLKACQQLQMEVIELMRLPQRKCVALKTDTVHDDVEYQLMKLSKEYEKNIYTIANFNTGFFLDVSDREHIHASSVFIAGESLQDWEFTLPAGTYLNLYYQGARDKAHEHLKRMLKYCDENGYAIGRHIMEFFVIDTHETRVQEEYITQLQIELENI